MINLIFLTEKINNINSPFNIINFLFLLSIYLQTDQLCFKPTINKHKLKSKLLHIGSLLFKITLVSETEFLEYMPQPQD